ncbi:MAG TPA: hypothetical protein VMJ93_04060 [Verrucomicrobiae bacterium]|nr:hypothetical protein [Verrucomicrobiae bacterium]
MPRYKVAHVKEQGVDLIIVPLDAHYGLEAQNQQEEIRDHLQLRANAAGLVGTVVPVWKDAFGTMLFLAPPNWHPFFKSLTYEQVIGNLNKEIFWD